MIITPNTFYNKLIIIYLSTNKYSFSFKAIISLFIIDEVSYYFNVITLYISIKYKGTAPNNYIKRDSSQKILLFFFITSIL